MVLTREEVENYVNRFENTVKDPKQVSNWNGPKFP